MNAFAKPALSDENVSRWLTWCLRHSDDSVGLDQDSAGWVPVQQLLSRLPKSAATWLVPTTAEFLEWIAQLPGERFEIQGHRVRARYGHSHRDVAAKLQDIPPEQLFHGTSSAHLDLILSNGLRPMQRTHVHLTNRLDYARDLAARFTDGAVLTVNASDAHRRGIVFYRASCHVWQVAFVSPEFLRVEFTSSRCSSFETW